MGEKSANFPCRRQLWQHGLLGALALLFQGRRAQAQATFKVTKGQAGYVERQKPAAQMCAQCLYFISPHDCVIVEGPVSPLGWCTYYGD